MKALIKSVRVDGGYGFCSVDDGPDVFFHRSALSRELQFSEQLRGRLVEIEVSQGERGPRAVAVRPAE